MFSGTFMRLRRTCIEIRMFHFFQYILNGVTIYLAGKQESNTVKVKIVESKGKVDYLGLKTPLFYN